MFHPSFKPVLKYCLLLACALSTHAHAKHYEIFSDQQNNTYLLEKSKFVLIHSHVDIPLFVQSEQPYYKISNTNNVWTVQPLSAQQWHASSKVAGSALIKSIRVIDLNADGTLDYFIETTKPATPFLLLFSQGMNYQTFAAAGTAVLGSGYQLRDLNNDGYLDVTDSQGKVYLVPTPTTYGVVFIHTDILGSVIGESDQQGNLIKTNEYKPFGEIKPH